MHLTFVETRVFTEAWHDHHDDEALRALQNELLEHPEKGDPIPGCPILRKLRCADASRGKGKRSGSRVIYLHTPDAHRIDLIAVFGKNEKIDLTKEATKILCKLAHTLRDEATKAAQRQVEPKRRPRSRRRPES